ncbi:MAG TPA: hypothetical protein VMW19_17125 [Myxococcota bacterium]|nr:hypothetical protein [Myxococcota bacterium]
MAAATHAARPATSSALEAALRARGFAAEDFRLEEEHDSELAEELGVAGGILKVRCRSTGEERLYATGTGSGWLGAFLMDLARGHFARAVRVDARGRLPITVRVPAPSPSVHAW